MDTLDTFEVPCTAEQSLLGTILLVPLNCKAALDQNRLQNSWFLAKTCFHNHQYVPFNLFWFSTVQHFFSVVLNSSLSLHNYLFPSLEKRSSKSNKSQNVQQLACAILKCVNSLISLYVNLHEMSLVPSTSEHLLKCKHKHWIEILHVCLLHKRCPIQTNSVSFHQPNIWKKIVHIFVSFLKQTSYYCYMRWEQKFGKFIAFSTKTTIHNSQYNMTSINLWAKDYPHAANGFLTLKTIVRSEYAV